MPSSDVRSVMLTVVNELLTGGRGSCQTNGVLHAVRERLRSTPQLVHQPVDTRIQEAILTQWHELFRTGYLAWGMDFSNPDPPFFHVTEQGRKALSRLSRDPSNPAGYLAYIQSVGTINPIAHSYLKEGVECFVRDLYKASVVMVGASAESVLLELRDAVTRKFNALGRSVPKNLESWQAKKVMDGLQSFFDQSKGSFDHGLREEYEGYWSAFNQFIRSHRNEAGHPTSIDPISYEIAHANLLIFPEQLKLANRLNSWIVTMT